MKIDVDIKNITLFESLSSATRIEILRILRKGPRNIGELARLLDISSAITTRHISQLEEAGLVNTQNLPGKRGLQKQCSLAVNEITLLFCREEATKTFNSVSIPVGQYVAYDVAPTCGLASTENFIGVCDDSRYFSDPNHVNASIIWFQTGWVEYRVPSYIVSAHSLTAIEISIELCSEFPHFKEDWPSDVYFHINDVLIGVWTSPGDFGSNKGAYTPDWWKMGTQHGLLKNIRITNKGTMLDGIHLSDVTLDKLSICYGKDLSLRISVPGDTRNPGGINIFGKGFGNYNQDIEVRFEYEG